jgi:hypothetical protein
MQTGPQNGTYDTGKIPPPRRNAALLYQDTAAWNGHEAVVRVSFCTQPKQTSHSESLNCGCAFFDPPPVTRSEKLKFQPPSRAGLKRCEWLKRRSAGGDGKSLGLSARVPEWATLCAHPQFREFGARGEVQTPAPSNQDRAGQKKPTLSLLKNDTANDPENSSENSGS